MLATDGRRRSAMRADIKVVDVYLVEWARWGHDESLRLGLPAETLLARIARYGADGAAFSGGPEPVMPDAIARVDAAICRLTPMRQQVVKSYYLRWEPVEAMARRCRMGRDEFRRELDRARVWLAGSLGL